MEKVEINQKVLSKNDMDAAELRNRFKKNGTFTVNIMSSPGSGKTSLLEKILGALSKKYNVAVIEGDLQTENDKERIEKVGVKAVQIQTGGACHLEAAEIERKQEELQRITNNGLNYKSEIEKQEIAIQTENKTFNEFAWINIFKKYEQWFSKSAIGAGTKDRFIEKLLIAYHKEHSKPLPIDELKKKARVLLAQQPLRIEPYTLIDSIILPSIEVDTITAKLLQKSEMRKDIVIELSYKGFG